MDPNQPVTPTPEKATGANKYLQPYKSRRAIILDNFLGGFTWSLGTFFGLLILTVVLGYFVSKIDLIPIIGSWIAKILEDATTRIQPATVPR
ncbi:hypothetical protein A2697_03555 [Candidatus Curtissbacteria bacterium RIFCSPHIGHO2_01_FULL_41_44]|uniref:Uncharacterized protein n=1 Tax=Candidatus Curtissbacteria bacterium RIFCSPLOWO2_01_FULL_42_50 TaxID=1797730 RepID=A0A1F5H7P7_9BACT|nr:MAG: hypothetical protein A2697_03555 [Candidatus Curtissbacteria bacterium RIFCSPHIGHO2_01_FULL_41_44]OGD94241.1 MAG: hypothetical protein A3C33_02710 [Candidatus Curtissbacteria bacterium RIFCSPHIGHO2_02_FULL_42_58]OGD97715.1 MAG: hypothetical protein A3E71_03220 [Candidatus Curtissbacteria bacterium RIFCSPHIGHO2_12_FULL_42_33]OGE00108.1 MAG: hypothetical protein A3B54_01770 [Candidatus Curtissbacteria bacterium RIFCSPLOWO2_01_FULL_42_50]OGE02033.1 MAG: hypothetical protein A3G16_00075 [Ca